MTLCSRQRPQISSRCCCCCCCRLQQLRSAVATSVPRVWPPANNSNRKHVFLMCIWSTDQRILTRGRMAVLSPLVAENGFVWPWPHLIRASFGLRESAPQTASRSVQLFCVQRSWDSQCFSMGRTTTKITPCRRGSAPHLIHALL